jgi:hypothetical protein
LPVLEITLEDTGETPNSVASFLTDQEANESLISRNVEKASQRHFLLSITYMVDRFLNLGQLIGRRGTTVGSLTRLRRTAKSGEMVWSGRRRI